MYRIIDIKPENKDIIVIDTKTNTRKKYLTPSELRPLYDSNPSMCENFKFDGRGFRYLPNGQQAINLEDIKADLERIEKHLSSLNNTTHDNFLVLDSNTGKNTDRVLKELTDVMSVLTAKTEELDVKLNNITELLQSSNNMVYNKLRELGMTMNEFEAKFEEVTTKLLKNTDKGNKFPHIDNADGYRYYLPKKLLEAKDTKTIQDILNSEDDSFLPLNTSIIDRQDDKGNTYKALENYEFLNLLNGHLKQMNDASINIEKQFMCDVDSQKHERTNDNISSLIILGTSVMATSAAAVAFGPAIILLQNVASNAFMVTSMAIVKKLRNVSLTNMDSLRRHNHDGKLHNKIVSYDFGKSAMNHLNTVSDEIKSTQIQLLEVKDVPLLYSDIESYNYYVADIRNFRILTLSCVYKKHSIFHNMLKKKNHKYDRYLQGSLFEGTDFRDKALFNFYCSYYLDLEIDNSNDIATQSEIDTRKALMLAFINAYFAAKVLYVPMLVQKPDLKVDYDNLRNMNKSYMKLFLLAIKYGLILQNIRVDIANDLLSKFLKENGINDGDYKE